MPRWPSPTEDEVAAVERVLRSGKLNYWTGEECRLFEAEYAARLGRKHAIALANGTVAIELALRAFGVGAGDEVIVPARTFVATASACVAVGATPVTADIDPDTSCVTPDTVAAALTSRTRAIIPVHVAGWPCDMPAIMALAAEHGLLVIEDCAQAHGARFADREVGSFGHAAAFSFCQDKIITTGGEGGVLILDDTDAHARAWAYKDHGKSLAKASAPLPPPGTSSYRWLHDSFGTNWRMTEMQAAMGRVALRNLDATVETRSCNARHLIAALDRVPGLTVPVPPAHVIPAYYRLMGHIDNAALASGWTRDRVLEAIVAEGVSVQYGTCAEIYRESAFADAGLGPAGRLPGAMAAHESSIAFFVHPTLTARDLDDTARATRKVLGVAAR
ncbi:MAG: DegT/DnrJ/EryC1/StrS aminotransferase family protein [Actinobacteria bacterium]|nr:DegT/DnrJ/EryC1/StrS aminotransferase family protein [Actinomycetota bacterium]